jgi:hypothetical protein
MFFSISDGKFHEQLKIYKTYIIQYINLKRHK